MHNKSAKGHTGSHTRTSMRKKNCTHRRFFGARVTFFTRVDKEARTRRRMHALVHATLSLHAVLCPERGFGATFGGELYPSEMVLQAVPDLLHALHVLFVVGLTRSPLVHCRAPLHSGSVCVGVVNGVRVRARASVVALVSLTVCVRSLSLSLCV